MDREDLADLRSQRDHVLRILDRKPSLTAARTSLDRIQSLLKDRIYE